MQNTPVANAPRSSTWIDDIESRSNLSRSQFLMWLGQAVDREAPIYNTVFAWRLKGDLDTARFQDAFNHLVLECDALRTVIEERDFVPRQRQLPGVPRPLEIVDLSNSPESLDAWLQERASKRLRIDHCSYDSVLILLGDGEATWYLNQHHIVTDATSWALLFERMVALYCDEASGAPKLESFAERVAEERQARDAGTSAAMIDYWMDRFDGAAPDGRIYGHKDRSDNTGSTRLSHVLSRQQSESLRELAKQDGVLLISEDLTLFAILATAQIAWLHRVTGRDRLTLGIPVHNRSSAASQRTAGLLMEVLPLQVEVGPDETLRSLYGKVSRAAIDTLGRAAPGVSTPDTSRSFDVLLNYIPVRMKEFPGFDVESSWVHAGAGDRAHKLRLQVHDFDTTGNLHLDFDFDKRAFDNSTRELCTRHLLTFIDAISADIDQNLSDIELLDDTEHHCNVISFNATDAEYPSGKSIAELVAAQAARSPDAIAVKEDGASWSYAELEARANEIAARLVDRGAEPGRTVLVCMERSMHAVTSLLAVLKTGAAYIPLDAKHPTARIRAIVEDIAASSLGAPVAALTTESSSSGLPEGLDLEFVDRHGDDSGSEIHAPRSPDSVAYIIYTSGSTGLPKGAMIPQRAMVNYLTWARGQYGGDGPVDFALHSSLAVDLTVTSIFVPLLSGGAVHVYPDRGDIDLPILRVFSDDAVDVVKLTPAHLALIREAGGRSEKIRALILGGEDLKRDLVMSVKGQFRADVEIYNEYGPTEATVGCMIHRFDPLQDLGASVPIGKPIANAKIFVADEKGRAVAAGLTGELCIAGAGLALGYLNRDDLTRDKFVKDTILDSGRMYRSGDLARFTADGRIEYLGRGDSQVKIRGARVELGEVESALISHPKVKDVAAIVTNPESRLVERCDKCGVPSNYPGIVFNDSNVCSMCLAFDLFEYQARAYFRTMDDFESVVQEIKERSDSDVHCLALVSGGKDSTYMLYQLVARGLRPLLFTLDNGYISEEALDNVRRAADDLGLELVIGSTPHMNEILADSLDRYSNVCHGCYKTIYTLSINLARERGLHHIVTGLSRGQIFETRLDDLFRHRVFDVDTIERSILEARKVYHRVDDAVARTLDVKIFNDDAVFSDIKFVDFYRYCETELEDLYEFLETRAPWVRPSDTGRSTNCLVNDVGIYVHKKERGFHNYALPYSWDVRIGHKTRDAALYELDDELNVPRIQQMLDDIGYHPKPSRSEPQLTAYYTAADPIANDELRAYLSDRVPDEMVPTVFVHMDAMPLNTTGKVDRHALPDPLDQDEHRGRQLDPPATETEKRVAALWCEVLDESEVGRQENFFDLGGVSLGAIQVMSRVHDAFGVELPVQSFFESPTVAAVAQCIEDLLVADIAALSDEEVERLLTQEDV